MMEFQSSRSKGKGNKAGSPKHEYSRTGAKPTAGQRVNGAVLHGNKKLAVKRGSKQANPFRTVVHGG